MSQPDFSKAKRGRPPSADAHRRALDAARDILVSQGFGRLTMEAVALKSGVSKPTLYRHWANAQELTMAALLADGGDEQVTGATAKERLIAQLQNLIGAFATTRGRQIAMTLASADPLSEYTRAFRNRVILSSREAGRAIIIEAVKLSEISDPDDIEAVLDMIYGPVFYRLLVGHLPLDTGLARTSVEIIWRSQIALA
jgi:AcrR family transcriptional regulator